MRGLTIVLLPLCLLSCISCVGVSGEVNTPPPACHDAESRTCQLWLASSAAGNGRWGVFAGIDMNAKAWLGVPEVLVPVLDLNMNEYRPWHAAVWSDDFLGSHPLYLESYYDNRMFVPGLAMHVQCQPFSWAPIHMELRQEDVAFTSAGSKDQTSSDLTGAFSHWHNFSSRLIRAVPEGEELFVNCGININVSPATRQSDFPPFRKEEATCLYHSSSLEVKATSTSGLGLFTQKRLLWGETIATTPLLVIDRSQMEIVHQYPAAPDLNGRFIHYTDQVIGTQLLVNYAYGHENSTILLLPTGIGVNFINHNATAPNAKIRWSTSSLHRRKWVQNYTATDILLEPTPGILMDFVALRDIQPGEEILIDYGPAWEKAWQEHVSKHIELEHNATYNTSVAEYKKFHHAHKEEPDVIRTQSEQLEQPYPSNIRTACFYEHADVSDDANITWSERNFGCLRHCDVQARESDGPNSWYEAVMLPIKNYFLPDICLLPQNKPLTVKRIPRYAVTLTDREYTSAFHLRNAFRHEIGVTDGFFPDAWLTLDSNSKEDFLSTPLKPMELQSIRWKDSGVMATYYGYRMGLDAKLRKALMHYANRLGIADYAKSLTIQGNSLMPDSNRTIQTQGLNWFVQRPKSYWTSNMHWISPADEMAHNDFLRVLSAAGFDEILKVIGNYFHLDGLVCYHATFIAVSHCSRGYVHYDFTRTGGKAFNIIIPLILVNETAPELEIRDGGDYARAGRYRYQYDEAAIMGDDAHHGTAAVDYRLLKKMRLAATVYVADVNVYNAAGIMNDFTQVFPPSDDPQFLLDWAGKHWKPDDLTVRLPRIDED